MRLCLVLAPAIAILGAALRLALPVTPADAAFREVVRYYGAAPAAPSGGNTSETSTP